MTLRSDMKKSPAVAGYIYAIHSPENPRHVKLGLSSNPEARLRQLQTGNPYKLTLIWHFPCRNMAEMESKFHSVFDKYRIAGGEWFDFKPIDDPEHLAAFFTILTYKHLAEKIPADLKKRLAKVEDYIASPAKFLDSQRASDELLARQFPDLDKCADDPAALEEYVWLNLAKEGGR